MVKAKYKMSGKLLRKNVDNDHHHLNSINTLNLESFGWVHCKPCGQIKYTLKKQRLKAT